MKKFFSLPIDWVTLFIPILLTITGLITIYTITYTEHGTSIALNQLVFGVIGLVAMAVLMFSDYRFWKSWANLLFVVGILLLLPLLPFWASKLPFVLKVYGAHRWLNLGFFQLQSAEIFKIIAAVFSARYISDKVGKLKWHQSLLFLFLSPAG